MATFTVTPSSIQHTKGGETTNVQFSGSVPQGLDYTISAAFENWITVTLDGNNTTITSNQNSGPGRTATVTFYDPNDASNYVDVEVRQEGVQLQADKTVIDFSADGGSTTIELTHGDVTRDLFGHTNIFTVSNIDVNNRVTISAQQNNSSTPYSLIISYTDNYDSSVVKIVVTQKAKDFDVDPNSVFVGFSGSTVSTKVNSLAAVSTSTSDSWLSVVTSGSTDTGFDTYNITASSLSDSFGRTGSVTFTEGSNTETVKVEQRLNTLIPGVTIKRPDGNTYGPIDSNFEEEGYTFVLDWNDLGICLNFAFEIDKNVVSSVESISYTSSWIPDWNTNWVRFSRSTSDLVDYRYYKYYVSGYVKTNTTVSDDDGDGSRSLYLDFTYGNSKLCRIKILQRGSAEEGQEFGFDITPKNIVFNNSGNAAGLRTGYVVSGTAYKGLGLDSYWGTTNVSVRSQPSWVQISRSGFDSGYDGSHELWRVSASGTSSYRSGTITVADSTTEFVKKIGVYQTANSTYTLPGTLVYEPEGGELDVFIGVDESSAESFYLENISTPDWITYRWGFESNTSGITNGDIVFIADENNSTEERDGYITFASGYTGISNVYVRQKGVNTLIVTPLICEFDYHGGSKNIDVVCDGDITADIYTRFVTLSTLSSSTGHNVYSANVPSTSNSLPRAVYLHFYNPHVEGLLTDVLVKQDGMLRISVSPSTLNDYSYTGGSQTVTLTNIPDSGVEIVNNTGDPIPDWVTITGSGATRTIAVSENSSHTYRMVTLKFREVGFDANNVTLLVRQYGSFYVTPSLLRYTDTSSSKDVVAYNYNGVVTTNASLCDWLSSSTVSTTSTSKKYRISVQTNRSQTDRSFNLEFNDRYAGADHTSSVAVTQSGRDTPVLRCTPSSMSFVSGGGSDTVGVNYYGSLSYDSLPSWLSLTATSSTPGVKNYYTVTAATNTGVSRNHSITFTDSEGSVAFPISQEAGSPGPVPVLSVVPSSLSFVSGGGSDSLAVTYNGSLSYNSGEVPGWLSVLSTSVSTGYNTYSVTAASNSGAARSFGLVFTDDDTSVSVPISQDSGSPEPSPISVSPSSLSFTESGGSSTVTVTSSGSVSYNALPGWITMTNSGGVYTVTAAANTGAARTHTITFTDETGSASVVVSQDASTTVISVSPSTLTFTRNGGYSYVTVTSSGTVSYSTLPDWITITNDGSVYTVTAAANTGSSRTHTITFTDGTGSATLVVSQASEYVGDRYTPIWKNTGYYAHPSDFPDDLAYKITVSSDGYDFGTVYEGYIPFLSASNRDIYVSRLVEDQFPNVTDITHFITWGGWPAGSTITAKIYQKGDPDVLLETYYFIRDWSYYMQGYYATKTLNDPINGHGCANMTIPYVVFTIGDTSFSLVETSNSGSQSTQTLNTPSLPVYGGLNSFYGDKKVELKGNNNTFVSYDLTYCGSGNLVYRNRFGGYDAFLIEGNIEKKEDYTRNKYNLETVGGYNIDRGLGGDKTLDVHIKTSYTAHTGWLTDDQAERLVFHLLSSPDIYFQSFEGYRYGERHADFNLSRVVITDSSAVYKKFKNGKRMVSYAITFELSDTKKIVY